MTSVAMTRTPLGLRTSEFAEIDVRAHLDAQCGKTYCTTREAARQICALHPEKRVLSAPNLGDGKTFVWVFPDETTAACEMWLRRRKWGLDI